MKDLEKAKALLLAPDSTYTCVLCRDDEQYTSEEKGIAPMMRFLDSGTRLDGFCAADRIVGKAAAMLMVLSGARACHGQTMSQAAVDFLQQHRVAVTYQTCVPKIINRTGDGICPMEQAVLELTDPQDAPQAIRNKLAELAGAKKDAD